MFKKNTTKNTKSSAPANEKNSSTLKSWITGKIGSFILLSATGYALYKFGIINKITNYFTKKDKTKAPETTNSAL